jgi:anti-sigma regulatory factor (Ser/Thr protein kinase)
VRDQLSLGADPTEVTRLNGWLDNLFAKAGLAAPLCDAMKLCLNEAVGNVMLYAFADQPDPAIQVDVSVEPDSVEAILSDNGKPFDPLGRPPKEKYTSLDTAVPGGFGIQLIRETASRVDYQRDDGWNRLCVACDTSAMSESR